MSDGAGSNMKDTLAISLIFVGLGIAFMGTIHSGLLAVSGLVIAMSGGIWFIYDKDAAGD